MKCKVRPTGGSHRVEWVKEKIFLFSCDLCRKGFLHQNQLYAHHKQRHSTENQTINENTNFSTFEQFQQEQYFNDDPIDLLLDTQ